METEQSISARRLNLRQILGGTTCTKAAPIFDTLSARIAEIHGWQLCKLSGSVAKAAGLGLPDDVRMANMSDLVGICRRIMAAAGVTLVVDADDGGAGPLGVRRTVRELEAAGVAAIEIEDNYVPDGFGQAQSRHSLMVPIGEQVAKLRAAVAAKVDPLTVIVARTSAHQELPPDQAIERIRAYAGTGVDAVMLPGLPADPQGLIIQIQEAAQLPLLVLGMPSDLASDAAFLETAGIRVQYLPQAPFTAAIVAIADALKQLGGPSEDWPTVSDPDRRELVSKITRAAGLREWEEVQRSYARVVEE
jgi:oxaloacetate decarboxylase